MPPASFDDKKNQIFWGEFRGARDAHGVDAWGGREWTPRAEGGAGTSRAGPLWSQRRDRVGAGGRMVEADVGAGGRMVGADVGAGGRMVGAKWVRVRQW